jgi:hypothetical protein
MNPMQLVSYPDALAYQWGGSAVGRDVGMQHQKLWEQHYANQNAQQQAANQQQQAFDQQAMQQRSNALSQQAASHADSLKQSDFERKRKTAREHTIANLASSFGGRSGGFSAFRKSLLG